MQIILDLSVMLGDKPSLFYT